VTYRLIEIEAERILIRVASALCSIVNSLKVAGEIVRRLDFGGVLGWGIPEVFDRCLPIVIWSNRIEKCDRCRLVEGHAGDTIVGNLSGDLLENQAVSVSAVGVTRLAMLQSLMTRTDRPSIEIPGRLHIPWEWLSGWQPRRMPRAVRHWHTHQRQRRCRWDSRRKWLESGTGSGTQVECYIQVDQYYIQMDQCYTQSQCYIQWGDVPMNDFPTSCQAMSASVELGCRQRVSPYMETSCQLVLLFLRKALVKSITPRRAWYGGRLTILAASSCQNAPMERRQRLRRVLQRSESNASQWSGDFDLFR